MSLKAGLGFKRVRLSATRSDLLDLGIDARTTFLVPVLPVHVLQTNSLNLARYVVRVYVGNENSSSITHIVHSDGFDLTIIARRTW
jgi:hypothetical protein